MRERIEGNKLKRRLGITTKETKERVPSLVTDVISGSS